jgi:hypothetical protein
MLGDTTLAVALALPWPLCPLVGFGSPDEGAASARLDRDRERLAAWSATLRTNAASISPTSSRGGSDVTGSCAPRS